MSIAESREKCKVLLAQIPRDALILSILVLASTFSFGLGYLAGQGASESGAVWPVRSESFVASSTPGAVVASKGGTKYYLPWCGGADRITENNKVWFASAKEAEAVGYTPADNCDGP